MYYGERWLLIMKKKTGWDNELLWNEKIIEKSEYENQKNEIKSRIEVCQPKIDQIKQKLGILTNTPSKKTIKILESPHFKEEELNKLWRLDHITNNSPMSFNSNSLERARITIKNLKKSKNNIVQKKREVDRFKKTRKTLLKDKLERHQAFVPEMLRNDLNKSREDYRRRESEVMEKISLIRKELKERNQILEDLNIELKDTLIIKKKKIALTNYLSDKLRLLPLEIMKCKGELEMLNSLLDIYIAG